MSRENVLPLRAPRVSEAQQREICRLALRQVPHVEIARRVGVHRNSVRGVLRRTRAALTINEDLESERAGAVEVYREVQRTAWERIEQLAESKSPAMLLAEVRQAQARIDTLMGLAPVGADDPALQLQRFKQVVVDVIRSEAPELAPKLADRLLAVSNGDEHG